MQLVATAPIGPLPPPKRHLNVELVPRRSYYRRKPTCPATEALPLERRVDVFTRGGRPWPQDTTTRRRGPHPAALGTLQS
jgi:hypothetical protein